MSDSSDDTDKIVAKVIAACGGSNTGELLIACRTYLEACEWSWETDRGDNYCRFCSHISPYHQEDCQFAKLLRKLRGE